MKKKKQIDATKVWKLKGLKLVIVEEKRKSNNNNQKYDCSIKVVNGIS